MSTLALRQRLVDIAMRDANKTEVTRNRAPWIAKYWPATSYPDGHTNREPYCAAAVTYWVSEWLKDPEVAKALGKTPAQLESWRCKSARAFDWMTWADKKGVHSFDDNPGHQLHTGDIMVFDMSHIGIVTGDDGKNLVRTIEANTGATGGRDGDGCFAKVRQRSLARRFIRILP